jgi:hypothetical protein
MAADEILDAAWAKEHEDVDRRVALAIAAHNQEDHARFRGLVTLGADFAAAAGSAALGAHVWNNANTAPRALASGANTPIQWDQVFGDTDGCFSLSSPFVLTVQTDGWYWAWLYVPFTIVSSPIGAGAVCQAQIEVNGVADWSSTGIAPLPTFSLSPAAQAVLSQKLHAGDTLKGRLYHQLSGTEHTRASVSAIDGRPVDAPQFALWRIGSL